jgi:hypothetical protein
MSIRAQFNLLINIWMNSRRNYQTLLGPMRPALPHTPMHSQRTRSTKTPGTRETASERGNRAGPCYAPAFVRGVRGRVRAMREIVRGICGRSANVQVRAASEDSICATKWVRVNRALKRSPDSRTGSPSVEKMTWNSKDGK